MSPANGYAGTRKLRAGEGTDGRGQLLEIQRGRLVTAMIEVAAERGVSRLSVASVVARSGVSRRTFYEIFGDGQECLQAALEDSLDCARSYVREAYDRNDAWKVRIRAALHALLCFLEDEPARARLLIVQSLGAGAQVLERRADVLAELIEEVDGDGHATERNAAITPLTAEGLVGSTLAVVHARLTRDARPALVELTNPLMSMIALPYLGTAAARKELARPSPARRRREPHAAEGASRLNGLPMRITYRTMRVLSAIAAQPGVSNRQVGEAAGIADQGQISKLLQRLERLGLVAHAGTRSERGLVNAWRLTPLGLEIERATGRSRDGR